MQEFNVNINIKMLQQQVPWQEDELTDYITKLLLESPSIRVVYISATLVNPAK